MWHDFCSNTQSTPRKSVCDEIGEHNMQIIKEEALTSKEQRTTVNLFSTTDIACGRVQRSDGSSSILSEPIDDTMQAVPQSPCDPKYIRACIDQAIARRQQNKQPSTSQRRRRRSRPGPNLQLLIEVYDRGDNMSDAAEKVPAHDLSLHARANFQASPRQSVNVHGRSPWQASRMAYRYGRVTKVWDTFDADNDGWLEDEEDDKTPHLEDPVHDVELDIEPGQSARALQSRSKERSRVKIHPDAA